jgi:hypothetical protein
MALSIKSLIAALWNVGILESWNIESKIGFGSIFKLNRWYSDKNPLFHYSSIPIVSEAN